MTPETKEHPTMEAGRELDAEIALKVMGWKLVKRGRRVVTGGDYLQPGREISGFRGKADARNWIASVCPAYSTDYTHAFGVVDKLEADGWRWTIVIDDGCRGAMVERGDPNDPKPGGYECHEVGYLSVDREEFVASSTLTVPQAVCLVALKALGDTP